MIFSHPIMKFQKVSNGWKATMDCHPFRVHYIKLHGINETGWMLEHVECIKDNMHEYLDIALHDHCLITGQRMGSGEKVFVEYSG